MLNGMSITVEELNKRIDKKVDEVHADRKVVQKAKHVIDRNSDRSDEVAAELASVRDKLRHWKHIVADLEDGYRHGGPEKGEPWADARVVRRQEELADLIEEGVATRDRLLDRLDVLAERSKKAENTLKKALDELGDDAKRLDHLRDKRRKIADNQGQISEHFYVVEFDCHDGTPVPKASYDALEAWCNNYGEPLRRAGGAVHINSGFRTRTYNAAIGGASMSVHVYDAPWQHSPWAVAVDHVCAQMSPGQVQNWHEANTHPDGMGRYGSFTHVDNRNRIGWADSRWIGP